VRFVWAVAAFVLAALMIGAGIAQRTIFEGPKTESQAIEVAGDAPYVLIDGSVLTSHDGSQNLRVQEDGTLALFPSQSSAVLSSTVWGDGVVDLAPGQTVARGEQVRYLPFATLWG
jgi:hypothetical protein